MTAESRDSPLTFHRVIEAFKFGFSWRSLLGDPAFNDGMNEVIGQNRGESSSLNKGNQDVMLFEYLILITKDFYDFISLFSP